MSEKERTIYSVSELNQMVRQLLEDAFPPLWVEGEISNFSCPASGHWYFSLKDKNAQIRCAMFVSKNRAIPFNPQDGMQVTLRAKISLYEPRGDFQLIADFMEEAGDGILKREFERLKNRLAQEGLFDEAHKKALPALPSCIGVITSKTGAAIHDILSILKRRFPAIPIILYPTSVQGAEAPAQITQAIEIANHRKECDVLIVGRGGGSLEDLWAFNDEKVARSIFKSEIPIVSAVGHEIDFTIADFVADKRAPTPSAAAELLSPDQNEWKMKLEKITASLTRHLAQIIQTLKHQLESLQRRLRHPGQIIQDQIQHLDEIEQTLHRLMKFSLEHAKQNLQSLIRTLATVSPLATLARGYAIISSEKHTAIRHVSEVKAGENITARLSDGSLRCKVL